MPAWLRPYYCGEDAEQCAEGQRDCQRHELKTSARDEPAGLPTPFALWRLYSGDQVPSVLAIKDR